MLTTTLNGETMTAATERDFRAIHAAMIAAGLTETSMDMDGERFAEMSITRIAKCAGLVREIATHEGGY